MPNIIADRGDGSAVTLVVTYCLGVCAFTGGSMKRVTFVTHFYAAAPPDVGCRVIVTLLV